MNISMIFSSCDNYEDAWMPYFTQLKKYWPSFNMPIYLGAESKRFSFDGFDIRCPLSDGPIYMEWSKRLLKLLEHVDTDYVLFTLDDFWLTDNVNVDDFQRIYSYMQKDKRMGFVCLKQELILGKSTASDVESSIECQYPELFRFLKGKSFRITTQVGIWKTSFLKKIIRSHESAWYFETRATWRSQFYWERVYGVKKTVLKYPVGGFFGAGQCYEDYINYFDYNLIKPCIEKRGLIKYGDNRVYSSDLNGLRYYYHKLLSILPKW